MNAGMAVESGPADFWWRLVEQIFIRFYRLPAWCAQVTPFGKLCVHPETGRLFMFYGWM